MKTTPDLSRRVESPTTPRLTWNCEDTFADVWRRAIRAEMGDENLNHAIMNDDMYFAGLTVEGAIAVIKDIPLCISNESCNICGDSGPTHCTDEANCLNIPLAAEKKHL